MIRLTLAAIVLFGAGCAATRPAGPEVLVRLTGQPSVDGYLLTLVPAPGARINARLLPSLELVGGARVQFDQTSLTADSAYFAVPPEATMTQGWRHLKGVLRVGVCPAGLNLCRVLALPIDTVFGGDR